MSNRKLCTGSAVLACLTLVGTVTAAPTFKVLYHERLDITARVETNGQQQVSFDAYGRHFDIDLELNDNIARGVSADRPDIKPYRGTVAGLAGSWVRLTRSRVGWSGVVSDGEDIYAIEPAGEMKQTAVQPLPAGVSSSAPIMYRLTDAILPDGAGVCGTDTTAGVSFSGTGRSTAQKAFTRLASDLSMKNTTGVATRQLVVNVVADHTFTDAIGSDPEGAIVARWDIVDGIWSSQVGIKIVLAPITILTDADDRFSSTTSAGALLSEVGGYRAGLPAHEETGLTHLVTGRTMDGNIIGISYLRCRLQRRSGGKPLAEHDLSHHGRAHRGPRIGTQLQRGPRWRTRRLLHDSADLPDGADHQFQQSVLGVQPPVHRCARRNSFVSAADHSSHQQ